ncbi:hypothetical protein CTI12_AA080390 [Artemisia annua]|uniref:Uncharacterized protein n=1 Tax=Artemisia annua TaxID=35608 RepID=A0A2U1Q341_ARTAN|nr:hypothetical protein CTI12_AA080390 [Artemisia annua]
MQSTSKTYNEGDSEPDHWYEFNGFEVSDHIFAPVQGSGSDYVDYEGFGEEIKEGDDCHGYGYIEGVVEQSSDADLDVIC